MPILILTTTGQSKLASAAAGGDPVVITHMAVGDANETPYTPTGAETALVNEVWRSNINQAGVDPAETNKAFFESVVGINDGGWFMWEVGLFDADGDLIAIGDLPGWYKMDITGTSFAADITIRLYLTVTNPADLDLIVSPSLQYLTQANVVSDEDALAATNQGKLLPWGAYGLGAWKPIANKETAIRSGMYSLPLFLGADNAPVASASGVVLSINGGSDSDYVFHMWAQANDTDIERVFFNHKKGDGTWTPGVEAYHTGNTGVTGQAVMATETPAAARQAIAAYGKAEVDLTGVVMPFATTVPPAGFLKCDGAAVSRTTYADLFAKVGTFWGAGDGSTTFNVPDLRGEFIRGFDDGRGIDTGRGFGTAQSDAFAEHDHQIDRYVQVAESGAGVFVPSSSSLTAAGTPDDRFAEGDTETRPRNIALIYYIKY